jgi:ubiquitin-protein ligase
MPESPAARTWSSAQLIRLESEWRRLQRAFAFHPRVELIPLAGDPPGEYQVQYTLTTLVVDAAGRLVYAAAMPVHLWLPPHFPHDAPVVRPMGAAFHPNVSMEWVHLSPPWGPDGSLVQVVTHVGELLAFRTYDPGTALNPVAMAWVHANRALLPTDPGDFSPEAGGEPLARVARHGAAAIEEQRRKVEAACDRLVSRDPPGDAEVRQFSWRVQLALSLFDAPDVPESLRAAAAEVEETVLSMRGPASVWAQVARQVETAESVGAAVAAVAAADEALVKALGEFDSFGAKFGQASSCGAGPGPGGEAGARKTLPGLPALAEIQPLALALRRVVREGEQAAAELRARLARLAPPPRTVGLLPGRMLTRRLEREAARASAAAEPARASGAVLASAEPSLSRARRESLSADRLAAWAEYADLARRGDQLVGALAGSDPARVHAFFASGPSGESGPFEYELPLDLGGRPIVVSNPRGVSLRVVDAESEETLACGDGAVTLAPRPGPATRPDPPTGAGAGSGGISHTVTLHPGQRTDELRVQLEYILTQTRDALARLLPDAEAADADEWPADSWAGRLAAAMDDAQNYRPIRDAHRRSSVRWKALLSELAMLGRFKQRLATHHLLARLAEFVPRVQARAQKAREGLIRIEARLAEIAARSGRDFETDQPLIPQHLAGEYAGLVAERDRSRHEIAWAAAARHAAADRVRARLQKPKHFGSADLPVLRLLAPLPAALAGMAPRITDAAIFAQVSRLEELLGARLRDPDAPASPARSGSA